MDIGYERIGRRMGLFAGNGLECNAGPSKIQYPIMEKTSKETDRTKPRELKREKGIEEQQR